MRRSFVVVVSMACILAACAQATPTPTFSVDPAPSPTATLSARSSPTPTASPTPTPKPTASPTPPVMVPPGHVVIEVGKGAFVAEVADDLAEQVQGLSGRESMAPGEAMWFSYNSEHIATFWMRGMHFPIDLVWIDGSLTVVDITANAPVPDPDTPTSELPRYSPSGPVQYVLEINAGLADELDIDVGSKIILHDAQDSPLR